ncbi:AAA family ATPase [Streptomyces spinoverrucosus]|uniref:AAA family ATPase n=1 Tax=Streptomyces spinoverrucosus TaxID=284043 RepID=UPI0018C44F5D|nr:AAA family ATPase [Streptomyces spinoverrucosus]MBG0853812.1 AAA family ATPase [Streptomyces spinoverrucosus]
MPDEIPELPESEINVRLAFHWLLNPNAETYDALPRQAQLLVDDIATLLPSKGGDEKTAALVEEHRRRGAILREAQRIVSVEEAKIVAKKIIADRSGKGGSWAPVNLDSIWEEAESETQTDVGYLTGDMPLGIFYRGKINGVHAESEAGKSWLACLVAAQEIRAHRHVAYIDFEDDAGSIIRRLKTLGASREDIATYFHYCNPTGPLTDVDEREFQQLVSLGGSLAIFDGMTESMALEGLNGKEAEDVAAWHAKLTKAFAAAQWAVVVLDHVPHDGNRALGSQHKKSAITGVSYFLDPVHPIGKGVIGKSRLRVEKDRPAWVRAHAIPGKTPQHFADLVIDFKDKPMPSANVWPARPVEDRGYRPDPPERLRKAVLGFVQHNPGASLGAIRKGVTGGNGDIDWALEWLIDHAQVIVKRDGQAKRHHPADPAGTLP